MGAELDKPTQHRPVKFNRMKFEIVCAQVFQHTQLHRDRKINELQKAEASLKILFEASCLDTSQICSEADGCINIMHQVQGSNIVLRNIKTLKEQSLAIESKANRHEPLTELEPMVHTVVWSTKRLNLTAINDFNALVNEYFVNGVYHAVEKSTMVDLELKKYFEN